MRPLAGTRADSHIAQPLANLDRDLVAAKRPFQRGQTATLPGFLVVQPIIARGLYAVRRLIVAGAFRNRLDKMLGFALIPSGATQKPAEAGRDVMASAFRPVACEQACRREPPNALVQKVAVDRARLAVIRPRNHLAGTLVDRWRRDALRALSSRANSKLDEH